MKIDLTRLMNKEGNIDPFILRDVLETLDNHTNKNILSNFEGNFYEITYTAAVANQIFKHNLNFIPKDVIILSSNPSTVSVSFVYENTNWDSTNVVITTDGAVAIRAIIGRYRSDQ